MIGEPVNSCRHYISTGGDGLIENQEADVQLVPIIHAQIPFRNQYLGHLYDKTQRFGKNPQQYVKCFVYECYKSGLCVTHTPLVMEVLVSKSYSRLLTTVKSFSLFNLDG